MSQMEMIFFVNGVSDRILHVTRSKFGVRITEYGRYNKNLERAEVFMTLSKRKVTTLSRILSSFYSDYTVIKGDLFITGSDKQYIFNLRKQSLTLPDSKVLYLESCHKNTYKSTDKSLYMLYDSMSKELLLLKKPNLNQIKDDCHHLQLIQRDGLTDPYKKIKRIKHFTKEYEVLGTIDFTSDNFINLINESDYFSNFNNQTEQDIKAVIRLHVKPDFESIEDLSCIYNIMQQLLEENTMISNSRNTQNS